MDDFSHLSDIVRQNGPITALLITIVVILRLIFVRLVSRNERLVAEARRRWSMYIRNVLFAVLVFGLIFIWAPQLQTFTATLILIAAAIAIATKELIACLSGAILRISTNAYTLGDRIEIGGVRGNVVDHNLLTTTLLEIGPGQTSHQYTGRAMIIPNSLLLTSTLTNETYTKKYILHITRVPLTTQDDWQSAEQILLEAGMAECQSYLDEAKKYMKQLEGRHWLDSPSVEPRVTIQLKEPGYIDLLLRVPCPPDRIARLEQAVLRTFMSRFSFAPVEANSTDKRL